MMCTSDSFSLSEVRALFYGLCSSSSEECDLLLRKSEELLAGPLGCGTKVPLPWTGVVNELNCHGLRVNHDLFTQCVNSPVNESQFCKTCLSTGAKNDDKPGVPLYGTIKERQACGPLEYSVTVKGKQRTVVPYAHVVAKLGLNEHVVRAIASSQNVTLPKDSFSVPTKKQRTKAADDSPVVANSSPATDLVTALIESAKKSPPSRTDIAKAKVSDLKEWCSSYALQQGTKKEMQQRLRKELQYTDAKAEEPATTKTEEPANAKAEEPVEEALNMKTFEEVSEEPVKETSEEPVEEASDEVETSTATFTQEGLDAIEPQFGQAWQIYNQALNKNMADKPSPGETDGVEEKTSSGDAAAAEVEEATASGRVSPSSELSEEAPFESVFCNIFTDEKTGFQYLKDEEGGLYDVLTRSEVGMVYEGRVILDADLED